MTELTQQDCRLRGRVLYIIDPHSPLYHDAVSHDKREMSIKQSIMGLISHPARQDKCITVRTCDQTSKPVYTQSFVEDLSREEFGIYPKAFRLEPVCSLLTYLFTWKLCEKITSVPPWSKLQP